MSLATRLLLVLVIWVISLPAYAQAVCGIGASVTNESFGVKSPGRIIAEKFGVAYEHFGRAGAKLDEAMPPDEKIVACLIVVSIDGGYWYNGFKPDCDTGRAAYTHLIAVRGPRSMILGTIPWHSGCADVLNPFLIENCVEQCILIRLEGDLTPTRLHPPEEYMQRIVATVMR